MDILRTDWKIIGKSVGNAREMHEYAWEVTRNHLEMIEHIRK